MELRRRTWIAALKLALVMSTVAAAIAAGASTVGNVPEIAIVLPVIVVAFAASWVLTGRVRSQAVHAAAIRPIRSVHAPSA